MKSKNIFLNEKKTGIKGLLGSVLFVVLAIILFQGFSTQSASAEETITVYKSPTCGCCTKWISHLEENGFKVKAINTNDVIKLKKEAGLKPQLASCHTAFVEGYAIEGHVPASDIKRLLAERPAVKGLTVPGMPMGSPGMEGPRKDRYSVLTFDDSGKTTVFSTH
ncbi:MAG: DUF411 domain-containing protein [Planctomycetia bacterium]|nr:DUF411 domain-containing protein [Planctomycetia bacterium]